MNTFFYLKTCSTCKRILEELNLPSSITLQDIKSEAITSDQLDKMKVLAGSYEALFSRRAQLYKSEGLKDKNLQEADYKNYILKHYTFLKRPVLVISDQIFIGNSAKTVAEAQSFINANE
ncbi:arsenate reductase family protein [Psychroserpens sp.]|uniref:arsenate reductase family protein n=1 Tax=Psychroserpens sp. TaxID=2020870 RepID=UPI001B13F0D5|nr:ArsC/Spx/MgsR family protein [Psychroserpens sp.]MBO6605529.1 hypothetical protein [Psychroserpens sp.]MBO6630189.1 hypothetical protein [Psychroserpens sp.]MBO6653662.1 hypothetical protein [Psychroserpens sp.]MBO6681983.1 hypothetical protein [Psychroserpens sp.]MBO6748903.1 hypothetical protein [Psychroserpens sp.]